MSLATGTRLGPYEILAPIGVGGTREVYRARDTRLGRTPMRFSGIPARASWKSVVTAKSRLSELPRRWGPAAPPVTIYSSITKA